MKPWINEEIFKTWTDAQKRLWDSLCSAVPFQPPAGVEAWRETYLRNLATWETAVKKTLVQEAAWVEQWVHKVAYEKGTPEVMASWVRQMEEVLQRWIQTQNQWWDEYFTVLRRGGFAYPEQAGAELVSTLKPAAEPVAAEPVPTVESVVAVEPAPAASEPVTASSEPAVEMAEPAPAVPEETAPAAPEETASAVPEETASAVPEAVTETIAEPVSVAATAEALVAETVPAAVPVADQPDDLKLISGIGPVLEKKLRACGILSYRQLASLSDEDIERIETTIKSAGRIRRDDWIGQARARHFQKYREQL